MNTLVRSVDPTHPDQAVTDEAAAVLRGGGLVAFPTETVYGLGANALDSAAVGRIFAAKGRPATNPVIVHVADPVEVLTVAASWPETAAALAGRFWPGPLSFVLPKRATVPEVVTAEGPTVAVRCPAHPVARALIRAAGVPVAAPSANRSTELSPTRAEHVLKGLNGRVDFVLDGGPCPGGIESTVVDVTGETVRLLRPGLISVPMLEEVVGRVETGSAEEGEARSPGQMMKHYSPRTPVVLAADAARADQLRAEFAASGLRVAVVAIRPASPGRSDSRFMPLDPAEYATGLYGNLHELDDKGYDRIVVELPPDTPEWAAVRDRLIRASR